jgi:uncharacterized membrane protein (UPF0182 family)
MDMRDPEDNGEGDEIDGQSPHSGFDVVGGWPRHTGLLAKISIGLTVLVVLFLLLNFARSVYTNILWFSSLELRSVYTTILWTKASLFVTGLIVMGSLTAVSLWFAWRTSWEPNQLGMPPSTLEWLRRSLIAGMITAGVITALSFATALSNRWEQFLLFINSTAFGLEDPLFHNDVGFYIFTMPMLHTIQGWLMGAAVVLLLLVITLFFLVYSIRGVSPWAQAGPKALVAIIGAGLMFTLAGGHFLDTYETLFSTSGAVTGATATDISARIPMLRLLTGIALLSGVIMLLALRTRTVQRATQVVVGAFGLWVVVGIIGGLLVPMFYQRFVVSPNELEREREFVARNIEWTRFGFDLDRVEEKLFDVRPDSLAADIAANPQTVNNIRLWDPRPLLDVYNQIQHLRLYYNFLDVDVDRYVIDGENRQVLLSTRELFPDGLDISAQNWVNRKLVYTHGFGVVVSPATDFTPEGQPLFFLKDVPPTGSLQVDQPRIYYSEGAESFVIVNSEEAQFDRPSNEQNGQPVYIERYEGEGGVSLSTIFRRAAFAWEFLDINVLISGQVTSESKALYRRDIRERIQTVAPFLRLDRDPYIVVNDGRLFWIQDAFTTTDRLPYSKRLNDRDFNYLRNSVKVVVDAFNGSLTFYSIEPHRIDPMLRVYEKAFPDLFLPISQMDEGLRAHIRYPEVLLRAQAQTFLQYHMTDPKEFFLKEDQWAIPNEVVLEGISQPVDPYYVIMKLPGEEKEEFVLILPFTPQDKPNLVAWMAARSDDEHYGDILVFNFPTDRLFNGPSQVEARIDNDPDISEQFTLWGQSGSKVIRGNLLVIPVGESLLYAEPIYLQAELLEFPELKRVILASADRVVMEPTLKEALRSLLSGQQTPAAIPGQGPPPSGIATEQLRLELALLRQVLQSFQEGLATVGETVEAIQDLLGHEETP